MTNMQNMITDIQILGAALIFISIAFLVLIIATCSAIIKIKTAINDIADVYCKINKEKFQEIKKQEQAIEKTA